MNRRNLVKLALIGTGTLVTQTSNAKKICLSSTKEQTEGPFYPEDWNNYEADADMTTLTGRSVKAIGQLTLIEGQVIDSETCQPIAEAQVDIWQSNAFGQYYHKNDSSLDELKDKNFQYRCRLKTNTNGEFSFKTIKPSPYPAGAGWIRPPHIHFKVLTKTHKELTTQMYFANDPLNELDQILDKMTIEEREGVIIDFIESNTKILSGTFTIRLNKI